MRNSPALTIGDLARATNTKVVTIRYYEKVGLLPPATRTAGNYRAYEPHDIDRLRFVRRCRDLGFTLNQIRDLLSLASQQDQDCAKVDRIASEHLAAVERKIGDLQRLADELRRINTRCEGGKIADCCIIEALSP